MQYDEVVSYIGTCTYSLQHVHVEKITLTQKSRVKLAFALNSLPHLVDFCIFVAPDTGNTKKFLYLSLFSCTDKRTFTETVDSVVYSKSKLVDCTDNHLFLHFFNQELSCWEKLWTGQITTWLMRLLFKLTVKINLDLWSFREFKTRRGYSHSSTESWAIFFFFGQISTLWRLF